MKRLGMGISLAAAALAGFVLWRYPMGRPFLAAAMALLFAAVRRRPGLLFAVAPPLYAALNLAPWTGCLVWNEADALMAAALSAFFWPAERFDLPRLKAMRFFGLFLAGCAVSALIGAMGSNPGHLLGGPVYLTSNNALHAWKGFAAGALLALAFTDQRFRPEGVLNRLGAGFVIALFLVCLTGLWERSVFTGLWDFTTPFRINATFASMHVGGGALEAFLILATPMLFAWLSLQKSVVAGLGALFGTLLAGYVMGVTFSRTGTVALAAALLAAVGLWSAGRVRAGPPGAADSEPMTTGKQRFGRLILALSLPALLALGIGSIQSDQVVDGFRKSFLGQRFQTLPADLDRRRDHWRETLALRPAGLLHSVFGSGLGSFPSLQRARRGASGESPETTATPSLAAGYQVLDQAGSDRNGEPEHFLRLLGGPMLYLDQRVRLPRPGLFRAVVDVRCATPGAQLVLGLCEKNLLDSFNCGWADFACTGVDQWEKVILHLDTSGWRSKDEFFQRLRPVVFSVTAPKPGTVVDIDNLALNAWSEPGAGGSSSYGSSLLGNGDFSAGQSRWFYTSDQHLAWRVKNLWVQLLLEQGWFGVAAALIWLGSALKLALGRALRGDPVMIGVAAALLGVLIVGMEDSLIDDPRVTPLLIAVSLAPALRRGAPIKG